MQNELLRKIIHLLTSLIPVIYLISMNKEQMSFLCISLFMLFLAGDLLRIYVIQLGRIFDKVFGKLLRPAEKEKKLTGATYLLLGFSIVAVFFEKEVAVISMLILSVCDSLAAIVGRSFGRRKWFGKTVEGSLTFFLATLFITGFFNDKFGINILGAALLTVVELLSGKLNDNLTIPIVSGLFFTFARII
jgi:dolichol kinase